MPTNFRLHIPLPEELAKSRGLLPGGAVRRQLAETIASEADPYVPMAQGVLKNTRIVAEDGTSITYNTPYARFLYFGYLMVGVETRRAWAKKDEKKERAKPLKRLIFSGASEGVSKRGPFWVRRMWKEQGKTIMEGVAKSAGGRSE